MRLKLHFELDKNVMSVEYRREMLSFMKAALTRYDNGSCFNKFFEERNTLTKPYSFGVSLPGAKFTADKIELGANSIRVHFSTFDYAAGIIFYNAFNGMRNEKYPLGNGNKMTLKQIVSESEQCISSNEIRVKFLSPLCVRKHDKETNKDLYMAYNRDGFRANIKGTYRSGT